MPVPDLDGTVKEKLIFEIDWLLEGELAHMDVQFAGEVEIEEVGVIEVESYIR